MQKKEESMGSNVLLSNDVTLLKICKNDVEVLYALLYVPYRKCYA